VPTEPNPQFDAAVEAKALEAAPRPRTPYGAKKQRKK
jgi:hypothetical protein